MTHEKHKLPIFLLLDDCTSKTESSTYLQPIPVTIKREILIQYFNKFMILYSMTAGWWDIKESLLNINFACNIGITLVQLFNLGARVVQEQLAGSP